MTATRPRIIVIGAGVAGSLVTAGLMGEDVDLLCLERAGRADYDDAGAALNLGPNAMKCLAAHMPASAGAIKTRSLPWRRWTIALTDGATIMDLDLLDIADVPGARIRWAELYQLLRSPIAERVVFGAEATACERAADGRFSISWTDN